MQKNSIFSCPLELKFAQGYLMVASKDLDMHLTVAKLTLKPSDSIFRELGLAVMKVFLKAQAHPELLKKQQRLTRLVKIAEASRELGLAPQTIRNLIDKKKIQVEKTPGGHRRIDLDELKKHLD